jgi:hypothetical protein
MDYGLCIHQLVGERRGKPRNPSTLGNFLGKEAPPSRVFGGPNAVDIAKGRRLNTTMVRVTTPAVTPPPRISLSESRWKTLV